MRSLFSLRGLSPGSVIVSKHMLPLPSCCLRVNILELLPGLCGGCEAPEVQ